MNKKTSRRDRMTYNRKVSNAIKRLAGAAKDFQPSSVDEACGAAFFIDIQNVLGISLEGPANTHLRNLITAVVSGWSEVLTSLLSQEAVERGLSPLHDFQFPPRIHEGNPVRFVEVSFHLEHQQREAVLAISVEKDDFGASLTVWVTKPEDDPDNTPDAHVEVVDPSTIHEHLVKPMFAYLLDGTLPE